MNVAQAENDGDLRTRVLVGAGLAAGALIALWLGGWVFWLLCCLFALGVLREWGMLLGAPIGVRRMLLFALSVPLALMGPLTLGHSFFKLGLLGGMALFVLAITRRPMLAAGVIYAGLPVFALLVMRAEPRGIEYTGWALALVWCCDIGAFFAGRWLGGARLAPAISPNKTWIGLAGGVAAASLLGLGLHFGYGLPLRLTLATPALALASQAGDLFESWLKRRAGVKDSGSVLPGHGGLLDRLDGLVPVAPLAALLVVWPHIREIFG